MSRSPGITTATATAAEPGINRLLSMREVEALTQLSRSTVYRLIESSAFPAPIHVGRYSRWSSRAVDHWIDAQFAAQ